MGGAAYARTQPEATRATYTLLRDGRIIAGGKAMDMATVEARFAATQKSDGEMTVILRAAPDVDYSRVQAFLDMARRYDQVKVGLVTGKAN